MRVIKFRAFEEASKVMHNDFRFIKSGEDGNDWIVFTSDRQTLQGSPHPFDNPWFQAQFKIMQFTGLLDKNGVEIYENSEIDNEFVVATKGCDYVLISISSGDILSLQDYYSGARENVKVTREYAGIPEDTKRRTN